MTHKKHLAISLAIGAAVIAGGYFGVWSSDFVMIPGMYIAAPFWPQGLHSDLGPKEVYVFLATVWLGTLLAWSVLSYGLLSLLQQLRTRLTSRSSGTPRERGAP